jgi:signal transduction histidine kinase
MNKLFIKYLVSLLAISIIPAFLGGMLLLSFLKVNMNGLKSELNTQVSQVLTREISYKDEAIAQTEGMYVQEEIDRIGNKISAMAMAPGFIDLELLDISAFVENFISNEPAVLEIAVVDKWGEVVFDKVNSLSVMSEEYSDLVDEDLLKTIQAKESYLSDVSISSRSQLPYVTLGQPIIQFGGNFAGGIILNLNLSFIWDIAASKQVGESGMLYIISPKGQLISHPSTRELYQNSDYSKYEYIREIMATKNGTIQTATSLVSYFTNKYGWTTIIEIPVEQALATVNDNQLLVESFILNTNRSMGLVAIAILIFILILTVVISFYVTRWLITPIINLTMATRTVSSGNLTMVIQKNSSDEIGELTDSFNLMTEQLRLKQEELLKSNEYIKQQAEELLDRYNSDLEQFAYVTTHDLIEPLRMITSYIQLLQRRYRDVYDDEAKEFMRFVVEGVDRMHNIINDLFEYSHIRTDVKDFEKVDVKEVLATTTKKLNKEITDSGAIITSVGLPELKAVQSNLVQVFQNLIGNAIKFRQLEVPLKIKISCDDREHDWLFSVEDNGMGFDPQYKEKVFEIFKRLNKRDDYPGSGMGLAISKNIVERHGGKIWVDSRLGIGTTFYFTIKKY